MSIRRLIALMICWGGFCLSLHADASDAVRKKLPELKGEALLLAYQKLFQLSTDSDVTYQLRCVNDLIDEARRQQKSKLLSKTIVERFVILYNYDLSDSIYAYAPRDLETLRGMKEWNKLYEAWTYLVNTYIFSEKFNLALREVQTMFDDAKQHNSTYGMGIAYYTMGNVYANMHNLDEAAQSYRKGLDLLKDVKPTPSTIAEIYSYYGDLLNDMKEYEQLEKLTVEWKEFLEGFIAEMQLGKNLADILWSYYYVACSQAALGLRQFEKAEESLQQVHDLIPSESDYVGMSWLFYRAQLYLLQGDYQKAFALNSRRLALLEDDDDKAAYTSVAMQRAEILKGLGRYQEAASFYQTIIQVKDSVSGAETRNQLNEMNTLFQVDELKMEQQRAQMRNTIIIASLIVFALVVFTIFRIRAARRLKKAHDQLEKTHSDLLVAYDQLEETTTAKERIESDLRIARNIQMGMVPRNFPSRPDLDLYGSMTPAKEVGGDLYGYYLAESNGEEGKTDRLYFCLGDVSGKGVPASLFMAQATRLFCTLAAQEMKPAEIATRINNALSGEDNETGMFVTMFLGLLDLETGHLDFCNAGHNPPVLLRDGKPEFIDMVPNAPVGIIPELDYEGEEIEDITNCPLFIYTDGLNEAENRQQEQFTDERLLELMEQVPFESCQQTIEMLREEVEKHRDGAEPNDDLTMLCVKLIKTQDAGNTAQEAEANEQESEN